MFKKSVVISVVIVVVALFFVGLVSAAFAQSENVVVQGEKPQYIVFQVGMPYYFVKGYLPASVKPEEVKGDVAKVKMDVAPYVENGRTFVPVRYLSNALGVENQNIYWCQKCSGGKVTLRQPGYPVVEMEVGVVGVLSDGVPVPGVDVAPALREGRTFLPARFVAEALGYRVEWLPERSLVLCWPKDKPKPTEEELKPVLEELDRINPPVRPPVQEEGWKFIGPSNNRVAVPPGAVILEGNGAYYKNGVQVKLYDDGSVAVFTFATDCLEPGVTFEQMLATTREVLMQTFRDQAFVDQLMDLVSQKSHSFKTSISLKEFTAPDGRPIMVDDNGEGAVIFINPPGQSF